MSNLKIKKAALELFAQKGFDGTTIKDLANKCNLKPSSIYSHITNKEDLFLTIFHECNERILNDVKNLIEQVENHSLTDLKEILYLFYTRVINHFIKNKNDFLFLKQANFFTNDQSTVSPSLIADFFVNDNSVQYFSHFFEELQKAGLIVPQNNADLFYSYIGIMIAYLEESLIYKVDLNDKHQELFWNIFWEGIKK